MSLSDGWTFKLAALDEEELLAKQEGGNRLEDMTGYGSDWPGTMKDQGFQEDPSKLPGKIIEPKQLELPIDLVQGVDMNPRIEQEASDDTVYGTPIIEGGSPDKGIGPDFKPRPPDNDQDSWLQAAR